MKRPIRMNTTHDDGIYMEAYYVTIKYMDLQ